MDTNQKIKSIPYTQRYKALKEYKQSIVHLEVKVDDQLYQHLKNRLQPNDCYRSAMQFIMQSKWDYCVGYFISLNEPHAWAELGNIAFDGTLQAFYNKEQYYELRDLKKVITRDYKSAIDLGAKYQSYGLYPEDQEILKDYI